MKSSSRTRRFGDLTLRILETHFVWKNTTFRAPAIYQNFTKCCACHEKSHSNFTKYCACHAKWITWLIRIRYETSFTMRGATRITLQLHQILRLPRKVTLMIVAPHIWNVIYNARSNTGFHPTSPNTAPATKSASSRFQRKLHELLPPIERRFDDIPTIKSSSRTRRLGDLPRPTLETHFVWKNTTFRAPAIYQNFTKCCACHEEWRSNFTKYCACHEICTLLFSTHLFSTPLFSTHLFSTPLFSTHLFSTPLFSMHLFSTHLFSEHLFSLGIYSLWASILSWHLFSLGIYSLLASILSWHLFSLGIYSLSASILSWHLFSLGIYSLWASILSWHLFSLGNRASVSSVTPKQTHLRHETIPLFTSDPTPNQTHLRHTHL